MSGGVIKSPVCPMCGELPMLVTGGWTQAFCDTDSCPVFTWNPHDTPEEFRRTAKQIEIKPSAGQGEEGPA